MATSDERYAHLDAMSDDQLVSEYVRRHRWYWMVFRGEKPGALRAVQECYLVGHRRGLGERMQAAWAEARKGEGR